VEGLSLEGATEVQVASKSVLLCIVASINVLNSCCIRGLLSVLDPMCGTCAGTSENETYLTFRFLNGRSQGSSVSTVSDYRLDDWVIGVRSPAEAKEFFL
jgi:hypothetical protein